MTFSFAWLVIVLVGMALGLVVGFLLGIFVSRFKADEVQKVFVAGTQEAVKALAGLDAEARELMASVKATREKLLTSNEEVVAAAYHKFHENLKALDEHSEKCYNLGRDDIVAGLNRLTNPNGD
jgi:hypothetical protein